MQAFPLVGHGLKKIIKQKYNLYESKSIYKKTQRRL